MTTTNDPSRKPGYRGSLPTREDRLARPWILAVLGIFVLIIVLSVAGIPSRFIPDPTPFPLPSFAAESAEPSGSVDPSADPSAEASASAEPSDDASPSASASASE
jgi:hypothetical protein